MAKLTNQEIADAFFLKNIEVDQIYLCNYYIFINKNSAELHAKDCKKKIYPFTRKEEKRTTDNTDNTPVKLEKLNKPDLVLVAEGLGIRPEEKDTKAQIITMIETVKANTPA